MLKKPTWSSAGTMTGIIGIGRNITAWAEAEQARGRLAKILEATPDLVVMFEPEGRATYLNPVGDFWLGKGAVEGVGAVSVSQWHPDWAWRKLLNQGFPKADRDGVWEGEVALLSPDGNEIPTSLILIAHRDGARTLQRYSAVYRDLTHIMEANRRILEQQNEIDRQRHLATMGEIASVIGHQLVQPITASRNYVHSLQNLISRDPLPASQIQDATYRMSETLDRIAEVAENVRAYLRQGAPGLQQVDINNLVREVAQILREEAGDPVQVRTDGEALWVECDPVQIREALLNLARNGLEAMAEYGNAQGALTLTTTVLRPQETVLIVVKDQGPGFPHTLIEPSHQPFFTTKEHGTGLGLSIGHSVVQSHNGTLELVNGKGSWPGGEARIRIPIRQQDPGDRP
jgi:two-component system sensor kinase FixL